MDNLDLDDSLDHLVVKHYCVSFIDLLGQRDALRGQGLLPPLHTDEQKHEFFKVLRASIGSVHAIHTFAEGIVDGLLQPSQDSPLRARLPKGQQETWDAIRATRVTNQRWSDGMVSFVGLGDQDIKCPLNGIFGIIALAGLQLLLGLAAKAPIRGAVELAWGVELRPGELYGPAIARAYELECSVAAYPRIVVGPLALEYLRANARNHTDDELSVYNAAMAQLCLDLLAEDDDGHLIVDYLGTRFREAITHQLHDEVFIKAHSYVLEQLTEHRKAGNSKLEARYVRLAAYFRARL